MRIYVLGLFFTAAVASAGSAQAQCPSSFPYTFSANTTAVASQVNSNFVASQNCWNGGTLTDGALAGTTTLPGSGIITGGGHVGIGTNSPPYTLSVWGGTVGAQDNLGGTLPTIPNTWSAQGGWVIDWNGMSSTPGEVDIVNTFRNSSNTTNGGFAFLNMANTTTVNPTPLMYLSGTGQLGIGTTSPSQALEVNGQVKVDSFASGSATTVCQNGNILASCSSSIRYKENVQPAPFGLNEIMAMRPVIFKWKGREETDFGLIAEEVEKIDPQFVTYKNRKIEGVKYPQLTAVLINAIKEQQAQITELTAAIHDLRAANQTLKNEVDDIHGARAASEVPGR